MSRLNLEMTEDTDNKDMNIGPDGRSLVRRDSEVVPEIVAAPITMEMMQQYLEVERQHTRRSLLWLTTIFLFVVLSVLTLFAAIGIFVLRNVRSAAADVKDIRFLTAQYSDEVLGISNRMAGIEKKNSNIDDVITGWESYQTLKNRRLRSEIERFGKWVMAGKEEESRELLELKTKLVAMEDSVTRREEELLQVKEQYEALVSAMSVSAEPADATAVGGDLLSEQPDETDVRQDPDYVAAVSASEIPEEPPVTPSVAESSRSRSEGEVTVVTFPNGDMYKGQLKDGFFNGWGVLTYKNGDRYEGSFKNDMKNGKGTFVYSNGDRFEGEFRSDMKQGQGVYLFQSGDRYVGEFKNDMIGGKGTMTYKDGNRYSGDFRNGMRDGNGVLRFSNDDVYEGGFVDDLRTGRGTYTFFDGSKYTGEFLSGKRHGKGRYVYSSGEEFIGAFVDGRKHGRGVCVYPNGERLEGLWENDEFVAEAGD
jgi:hypothetical protein